MCIRLLGPTLKNPALTERINRRFAPESRIVAFGSLAGLRCSFDALEFRGAAGCLQKQPLWISQETFADGVWVTVTAHPTPRGANDLRRAAKNIESYPRRAVKFSIHSKTSLAA